MLRVALGAGLEDLGLNWSTLRQKLVCKPFPAPNAGSRQGCAI